MWKEQVRLGMVPYYMFIARDTGAQEFFAVSLLFDVSDLDVKNKMMGSQEMKEKIKESSVDGEVQVKVMMRVEP